MLEGTGCAYHAIDHSLQFLAGAGAGRGRSEFTCRGGVQRRGAILVDRGRPGGSNGFVDLSPAARVLIRKLI
jgi:hypothetical protein